MVVVDAHERKSLGGMAVEVTDASASNSTFFEFVRLCYDHVKELSEDRLLNHSAKESCTTSLQVGNILIEYSSPVTI